MANEVAVKSPLGPSRELARLCFTLEQFDTANVLASLPAGGARHISPAIAHYERRLIPLQALEPKMDGSETRQVLDAFKPIGAKMRPDMSVDQGAHWATAIVLALSDLPAWIAVQALREAVHIPFDFPTEMETQVREIANRIHDKHLRALRRLRSLQDAILRATNAQPLIEDAIKPEEPMTLEEVRKMYRGALGKELVRMGLTAGAIREEDLAIVCAEVEAEASCQERANCGGSLHPTASNASHNGKERGKSFGSPPQPRTPKSSKGLSVSNKRQGWSTHSEGTRSISPASRIVSAQAPQPPKS